MSNIFTYFLLHLIKCLVTFFSMQQLSSFPASQWLNLVNLTLYLSHPLRYLAILLYELHHHFFQFHFGWYGLSDWCRNPLVENDRPLNLDYQKLLIWQQDIHGRMNQFLLTEMKNDWEMSVKILVDLQKL